MRRKRRSNSDRIPFQNGAAAPVFFGVICRHEHLLPDYTGGSIANLMRTIADACGAPSPRQAPLAACHALDARDLSRRRNIVLLIVDGLGAGMLAQHGTGSCTGTQARC